MMSHAIGTLKQYKKKQINRIKTVHFEYELITDSFKETQTCSEFLFNEIEKLSISNQNSYIFIGSFWLSWTGKYLALGHNAWTLLLFVCTS